MSASVAGRPSEAPLLRRAIGADRGDAGVRLDRVLLRRLADLPHASRTRIQGWIEAGQVSVNGRPARRVAARVAAGDAIEILLPAPPVRVRPSAEPRPLAILHEDADCVAIDKPAGLLVHPSGPHRSGTVLNALLSHAAPGGWTPRLVNRLDRQTSGVLLVSRHAEAHRALVRLWPTAAVGKRYLAVVIGRPPARRGEVRLPLGRDPIDPRRVVMRPRGGRESLTRYEVLAVSRGLRAGLALVACDLLTGRMHQIRVHLAALGCPVAGDAVYGRPLPPRSLHPALAAALAAIDRHALHAWRLTLLRPGAPALEIESPLPEALGRLLLAAGIDVEAAIGRLDRPAAR